MTRQETKALMPLLQAYAEGKVIEQKCAESWVEVDEDCDFHFPADTYRIKPSPTYRPFKNAEECWQEMLKHQPFGWVIKQDKDKEPIVATHWSGVQLHSQTGCYYDFEEANRILTFADGSAFGKLEE